MKVTLERREAEHKGELEAHRSRFEAVLCNAEKVGEAM